MCRHSNADDLSRVVRVMQLPLGLVAGLRQLGSCLELRQQRTRKHQRLADPVGLVDDVQAVEVAVGYEDAEGEGDEVHFLGDFSTCSAYAM